MIRNAGRFVVFLSFLVVILFTFSRYSHYVTYALTFMGIFVAALWMYKGYDLGMKSVRGQFYTIMSVAFLLQSIGFIFTKINGIISLSVAGIIFYTLARFFFFMANFRYTFYFQSLGYRLDFQRVVAVVAATVIAITVALFIPNVVDIFLSLSPYLLFVVLDVGMVFIVIYNTLLLWGGDLAKRWAIGSAVIFSYLLGDTFFIGGFPPWSSVIPWTLSFTLMSLMRGKKVSRVMSASL